MFFSLLVSFPIPCVTCIYCSAESPEKITPLGYCPDQTVRVLVSCHSLVYVDENLIGDPMEKATLLTANWTLTKGKIGNLYFIVIFLVGILI